LMQCLLNSNDSNLCSPNEDLGRRNKRSNHDFRSTFQGREFFIWATNYWKVFRESGLRLLFLLPKSSFGMCRILPCLPWGKHFPDFPTTDWARTTIHEADTLGLPNPARASLANVFRSWNRTMMLSLFHYSMMTRL
jgi:hypothetical protein